MPTSPGYKKDGYTIMLLIGFGSKARHGKDTAAEAIYEFYESKNQMLRKHGQHQAVTTVRIFKFATALYEEVNGAIKDAGSIQALLSRGYVTTDAWDGSMDTMFSAGKHVWSLPSWVTASPEYEPTELAPYGKHPKLLQWWGTEFRRAQDQNYWVNKLFASIPSNTDIALISDVRFPNEADGIVSRGGYNVNVQRLRVDGSVYYSTDRPVDHPSETALDSYNWQFRLINHEGHQALLEEEAITLAEYLRGLK